MFLKKLWQGLTKSREAIGTRLRSLFSSRKIDASLFAELEEILYTADLGTTGTEVLQELEQNYREGKIKESSELLPFLHRALVTRLESGNLRRAGSPPTVILVAGVNGSGKTTSIAKLAGYLRAKNHSVMLAACDTFRAAAVEQLTIWSERLGVQIIKQGTGADPASVAFDAVESAVAKKVDYLIVDTAGRLHTQKNLMAELEKIRRVLGKRFPEAPHEVLLVLDATTGQNAVTQAQEFTKAISVTGLFLSKLDGTAKGGAVFGIRKKLSIPIKFIGTGEGLEDIAEFDTQTAENFVSSLLGENEANTE